MSSRNLTLAFTASLLAACGSGEVRGPDDGEGQLTDAAVADGDTEDEGDGDEGEDADDDEEEDLLDGGSHEPVCTSPDAGTFKNISFWVSVTDSGEIGDKVDLLFVIDNSGSMAQEQEKLAEQLPRLLRTLISGEREDGSTFSPVQDLHVGVVTTDLGTNGSKIELPPSCRDFGNDAKLVKLNAGCATTAPTGYLSYVPSSFVDQAALDSAINDFTCLANVGIAGCGFEQQLEAMYKAVAPSTVTFAKQTTGHGDGANAGFLREDAVLAVIHVSDEEDCSMTEAGDAMFDDNSNHPALKLAGTDSRLGLNIRCAYRSQPDAGLSQVEDAGLLHPVDRYVTAFRETVKPNTPERMVFAAIVGVREETQDAGIDAMLAHPRMQFFTDPATGGGDPTNRNTASLDVCRRCKTLDEATCFQQPLNITDMNGKLVPNPEIITGAKPAIRFANVAKGFGENGIVRSICAESYGPAIDAIGDKISEGLGATCLTRHFAPNRNGVVGCNLLEILPKGVSDPAACEASRGRVFREFRDPTGKDRRVVCQVNQIAVTSSHQLVGNRDALPGVEPAVGWYYDTFSSEVISQCSEDRRRRVSFYPESATPVGTTLRLDCRDFIPAGDAGVPDCLDDPGQGGGGGRGDI